MYACILESGRGFFEGVCAPSNTTAYFCDPPPTPRFANRLRRYALALLRRSGFLLSRILGFEKVSSLRRWAMNTFRAVCDHTLGIRSE